VGADCRSAAYQAAPPPALMPAWHRSYAGLLRVRPAPPRERAAMQEAAPAPPERRGPLHVAQTEEPGVEADPAKRVLDPARERVYPDPGGTPAAACLAPTASAARRPRRASHRPRWQHAGRGGPCLGRHAQGAPHGLGGPAHAAAQLGHLGMRVGDP